MIHSNPHIATLDVASELERLGASSVRWWRDIRKGAVIFEYTVPEKPAPALDAYINAEYVEINQ